MGKNGVLVIRTPLTFKTRRKQERLFAVFITLIFHKNMRKDIQIEEKIEYA